MAGPRSPLANIDLVHAEAGDQVRLAEPALGDQLELRAGPAARLQLERELGLRLPTRPNTWSAGPLDAYWLRPETWLLAGGPGVGPDLTERSAAAAAGTWHSLVDVSDQRTVLEVSGPTAIEILAGGCPIDLHPRAFGVGDCAQTVFAGAGILIALIDTAPTFRVFVRSSSAAHVAEWLLDAIAALNQRDGEIDRSRDGAAGRL